MLRRSVGIIVALLSSAMAGGCASDNDASVASNAGGTPSDGGSRGAGEARSTGGTNSTRSNDNTAGVQATGGTTSSNSQPDADAASPSNRPNVIVVLTDDQGYADVGCFGAQGFTTPNLDRMAAEGIQFTSFYSTAPVCTPSRAALMTGCYPDRVGLPDVLYPNSTIGLNPQEVTIADVLKSLGYATGAIGKWHLGDNQAFLPTRQGFDEYFGLPYSNDMSPLQLMQNEEVIEYSPDLSQLTKRYTAKAVDFIARNQQKPFFLYLAHSMPHMPIAASEDFVGRTERGLYGDVITEIDWSIGQLLNTLDDLGLADNTLITFASDNGPWLIYGSYGGSAVPLREGKGTTFDGGMRVPGIMRWPARIKPRTTTNEVATTMDLLPTIAEIVGAELPSQPIDGESILPILQGWPRAASPHGPVYFYSGTELQAVRSGRWKLHVPHGYATIIEPGTGGNVGQQEWMDISLSLFDIEIDPTEKVNLATQYPEVVSQLTQGIAAFDADLKSHQRPVGQL